MNGCLMHRANIKAGDQDFHNKSDRKRNHLSMTSDNLGNVHGPKVMVSQAIQLTTVVKPVDHLQCVGITKVLPTAANCFPMLLIIVCTNSTQACSVNPVYCRSEGFQLLR